MNIGTNYQRLVVNPVPFDAKRANWYVASNQIVIESVAEYLIRIPLDIRDGSPVAMYIPKDGYTSLGNYPIEDLDTVLINYDTYLYAFIEGIQDADFVPIFKMGGGIPTNHAALSNLTWADSGHTGTANKIAGFGASGEAAYFDKFNIEDIAFEFADVIAGTAKDYTLDIKASYGYTIEAVCLETDTGTLTGVAIKIGSTAVTGLSSITVDSSVDETSATAAKTVVTGNRVYLSVSTGYSGAPTLIRGKIKTKRT